jgi:hypothetical protein
VTILPRIGSAEVPLTRTVKGHCGWGRDLVRVASVLCLTAGAVAAQQAPAPVPVVSNLARVQLTVVVPPRVTLAPAGSLREISRTDSTAVVIAPLGVGANMSFRVLVHRVADTCRSANGTERRVWVRTASGAFTELTDRPAVITRAPRTGAGEDELQYRVTAGGTACDAELPVRYDILVAPTV